MDRKYVSFLVLKILGLAPFHLKVLICKKHPKTQKHIVFSSEKCSNIYNCVLLILNIYLQIWLIRYRFDEINSSGTTKLSNFAYNTLDLIAVSFIVYPFSERHKTITKILNEITRAECALSQLHYSSKKQSSMILTLLFIHLFLFSGAVLINYCLYNDIFSVVVVHMSLFIITGFIIQYGYVVHFILNKFKIINTILEDMIILRSRELPTMCDNFTHNSKDNQFFTKFSIVRKLYSDLYKITRLFSKVSSMQVIASLSAILCLLCHTTYFIILHLIEPNSNYWIIIHVSLIIVELVIPVIALTKLVTETMDEVKLLIIILIYVDIFQT